MSNAKMIDVVAKLTVDGEDFVIGVKVPLTDTNSPYGILHEQEKHQKALIRSLDMTLKRELANRGVLAFLQHKTKEGSMSFLEY